MHRLSDDHEREPKPYLGYTEALNIANKIAFETFNLTELQAPIFEQLREKPVGQEWLDEANRLIRLGSEALVGSDQSRDITLLARRTFWGEHMGWDDPDSSFHSTYQRLQRNKPSLSPLSTSIESIITLDSHSIDVPRMIQRNVSVLWKKASTLETNILGYSEAGYDAVTLVNSHPPAVNVTPKRHVQVEALIGSSCNAHAVITSNPKLLTRSDEAIRQYVQYGFNYTDRRYNSDAGQDLVNFCFDELGMSSDQFARQINTFTGNRIEPEKMMKLKSAMDESGLDTNRLIASNLRLLASDPDKLLKRISDVSRVCAKLQWDGSPLALINHAPRVLASSDRKLAVHARLFARFGRRDMSSKQIIQLLAHPLEAHLITIGLEHDYSASNVKNVNKMFPQPSRAQLVGNLLSDRQAAEAKFGRGIVLTYERYVAHKKPPG
ncbi:MAG: hypothetical protein ACR2FM_01330 [Candidatus Saccharimonadales bacterium]